MVWMMYLVVAVLLCAAIYLLSTRPLWKCRSTFSLDAKKKVAMVSMGSKKDDRANHPTMVWSPVASTSLFEIDQKAAEAQLQDELAAVTASDTDLSTPTDNHRSPVAASLPGPVMYVNPKQYHRILKRRIFRQELAESLRKTHLAKLQGRTLRRSRAADGMLMALS